MNSLSVRLRGRLALLLAIATAGTQLAACIHAPPDTDFELTNSIAGDQEVSQGGRVTFDVTLRNTGHHDGYAPHLQASSYESALWSLRCKSAVGMACPTKPFAYDPDIGTMKPGASITFEYVFTIGAQATGGVDIGVVLSAMNDSVPYGRRVTTAHFIVGGDALSGAYQLYGSNGRAYAANADFSGEKLTLADADGGGLSFDFGSGPGIDQFGFRVSESQGFHAAHDLLVGNLDFGSGPLPFVAARNFVQDVAALDGTTFLVFGRELPAGGAPRSHVFTAAFSGTTMSVCRDPSVGAPADCPAASAASYALTSAADGMFVATDAAHGDTTVFRVARSQGPLVFLRADASADGRRFDVGMPVVQAWPLFWSFWGTDTRGQTGDAILTSDVENAEWYAPQHQIENTSFVPVAPGPLNLRAGTIGNDGSLKVYAAVFGQLALVAGAPGGTADGLLQIFMQ
jgi:hypothetical protein